MQPPVNMQHYTTMSTPKYTDISRKLGPGWSRITTQTTSLSLFVQGTVLTRLGLVEVYSDARTSRLDVYVEGLQYCRLINKQYGAKRLTALQRNSQPQPWNSYLKLSHKRRLNPKKQQNRRSLNLKSSTRLTCKDYSNYFESSGLE